MFHALESALHESSQSRRREFLQGLAAAVATSLATGCGSILYPERVGQPRGPLNWKVVALDTVGLLFFFVPGVIAFAVDFYNGTIYLPPEEVPLSSGRLSLSRRIDLPAEKRNLTGVQEVIRGETNVDLDLQSDKYLTCKLSAVSDAPSAAAKLEQQWQQEHGLN